MKIGDILSLTGFFTRQINLQGQTLQEIEKRLGFHIGRLGQGAAFLVATRLPAAQDFDFAGYSQVAGHHTMEQYGDINNAADSRLSDRKTLASNQWGMTGIDRLVKVLPFVPHDPSLDITAADKDRQYPPGSGIQQWKLTSPIDFMVETIVVAYPNGRYIPAEGFTPLKYK